MTCWWVCSHCKCKVTPNGGIRVVLMCVFVCVCLYTYVHTACLWACVKISLRVSVCMFKWVCMLNSRTQDVFQEMNGWRGGRGDLSTDNIKANTPMYPSGHHWLSACRLNPGGEGVKGGRSRRLRLILPRLPPEGQAQHNTSLFITVCNSLCKGFVYYCTSLELADE